MNSDQLYLTEYFHQLFAVNHIEAIHEWATAFDVYRSAWFLEDCNWMLRLAKSYSLEPDSQLVVLEQEGLYWFNQTEWRKAETALEKAKKIAEELGDQHSIARTLGHLGMIEQANGHLPKALDLFRESDLIFEKLNDQEAHSTNLVNMAGIYDDLGDWETATSCYNKAISIKKQFDDKDG